MFREVKRLKLLDLELEQLFSVFNKKFYILITKKTLILSQENNFGYNVLFPWQNKNFKEK